MAEGPSDAPRAVKSAAAPAPVGPYSPAIVYAGLVYVSGQIPLDPTTGSIVEGEIEDHARRAIANLAALLDAAGSSLRHVLKTTVYLVDLSLFPRVNAVYAEHFDGSPPPARATLGVESLPLGAQIDIEAIARTAR